MLPIYGPYYIIDVAMYCDLDNLMLCKGSNMYGLTSDLVVIQGHQVEGEVVIH